MLGLAIHQVQRTSPPLSTYPMSFDKKYEGYSSYNMNKTLQGQSGRNHLNLPMNSLLIFIEI